MAERSVEAGNIRPAMYRHDFEQTEHYHLIVEARCRERGINRGEAYRQFIDEALARSALRISVTKQRAQSIRDRCTHVARAAGGAVAQEMAAVITDVRRIEEVT